MNRIQSAAIIVAACAGLLSAQGQKMDGIVAVVGDEIILQSELDAYCLLRMNALNMKPDSSFVNQHKKEYLEDLIDGKVLLVHAKQDTTISVTDDDVDKALENHLAMIMKQNNWTEDVLEQQVKAQGMTFAKFKSETRKAIREQLYKQKVQQQYYFQIKAGRRDVEEFYNQYADSLPKAGESVLLSKLTLHLVASDSVRQAAFEKIHMIKQQLSAGADFKAMARKYSEGPEADSGGDLGFIKKGTLSELAFEEKAFSLGQGEVSEPFESHMGFHIIKVVEKRDQMVHVLQIFVKVAPSDRQTQASTALLDSIRNNAKTGDDFVKAVRKYSTDPETRAHDGRMKWYMIADLPPAIRAAVDTLGTGAITPAVPEENGESIYRVDQRVKSRALTLDDDWDMLAEKTKDILAQKKLQELVQKWRQEIFIDIRG